MLVASVSVVTVPATGPEKVPVPSIFKIVALTVEVLTVVALTVEVLTVVALTFVEFTSVASKIDVVILVEFKVLAEKEDKEVGI